MEKEYRFKLPTGAFPNVAHTPAYAIAERLERMLENEAEFHLKLLNILDRLDKQLLGIQNAETGR